MWLFRGAVSLAQNCGYSRGGEELVNLTQNFALFQHKNLLTIKCFLIFFCNGFIKNKTPVIASVDYDFFVIFVDSVIISCMCSSDSDNKKQTLI